MMKQLLALFFVCAVRLGAQPAPQPMSNPPSLDGTTWALMGHKTIFGSLTVQFVERAGENPEERQLGGTWSGSLFGCTGAECQAHGTITGLRSGATVLFALLPDAKGVLRGRTLETAVLTDSTSMHGADMASEAIRGDWTRKPARPKP